VAKSEILLPLLQITNLKEFYAIKRKISSKKSGKLEFSLPGLTAEHTENAETGQINAYFSAISAVLAVKAFFSDHPDQSQIENLQLPRLRPRRSFFLPQSPLRTQR
jgi:hypothetical protein